ncbi:MAG: hypothetical protein CVU86_08430, partial [Firmicutes bacterium HGW-Firmicutes-11]
FARQSTFISLYRNAKLDSVATRRSVGAIADGDACAIDPSIFVSTRTRADQKGSTEPLKFQFFFILIADSISRIPVTTVATILATQFASLGIVISRLLLLFPVSAGLYFSKSIFSARFRFAGIC